MAGWLADTLRMAGSPGGALSKIAIPAKILPRILAKLAASAEVLDTLQMFRVHVNALKESADLLRFNRRADRIDALRVGLEYWALHALSLVRQGGVVLLPIDLLGEDGHHPGQSNVTHATTLLIYSELKNGGMHYYANYYVPEGREDQLILAGPVDREREALEGKILRGKQLSPSCFKPADRGREAFSPQWWSDRKTKSFPHNDFEISWPSLKKNFPSVEEISTDAAMLAALLGGASLSESPITQAQTVVFIKNILKQMGYRDQVDDQRMHGVQGQFTCEYKSSVGPLAPVLKDELSYQAARFCLRSSALDIVNKNTLNSDKEILRNILIDKEARAADKFFQELR
jgi:hypothetical protein